MALFNKKKTEDSSNTAKQAEKTAVVSDSAKKGEAVSVIFPASLVQPRISEKAGHLVKLNKYIFLVKKSSNKITVKKAVEKAYKVKVLTVNMVNVKGKARNFGRFSGRTSDFKKAIVTLKKGDTIEGLTDVV